jgi:cell wall-associated NlpC family hydrolase
VNTATHRASKPVSPKKATAIAVIGFSAGSVALAASPSQAETLAQAKAQYQQDLGQAEAAGQDYDQQEQAYARLQAKIDALQGEISTRSQEISALKKVVGAQAAEQYRDAGGVSTTLQLALSASPTAYLDGIADQNVLAAQEAEQLKTMAAQENQMRQQQAMATTLIQQQQQALAAARNAKQKADSLTADAKALIASLTPAQQEQVDIGAGGSNYWLHYTGTLPVPTGRAATAVQYAESKIGDAYVYAANGPDTFDCSGLTQQAWKAAGVSIPRTSFDQYADLPHVSEADLRPGDLVFFFPTSEGPSHVGVYVGNGMYVQATHPGSYIQWASLDPKSPYYGNMPYVGAARP